MIDTYVHVYKHYTKLYEAVHISNSLGKLTICLLGKEILLNIKIALKQKLTTKIKMEINIKLFLKK
jgi:hypothetical protein